MLTVQHVRFVFFSDYMAKKKKDFYIAWSAILPDTKMSGKKVNVFQNEAGIDISLVLPGFLGALDLRPSK